LAILNHMYNTYIEPAWRYLVFVGILDYALKTGNTSAVEGSFETVDTRLKEWGDITPAQRRKVYDLILRHLDAAQDGYDDEQFEVLLTYLSTFDKQDPDLPHAKDRIKTLIVDLIKDPQMRIDNILQFPVVAQLREDPAYAKVYRLLEIFAKEGPTDYLNLYQQDPAYFKELSLVHDECLAKIRLLALLSLGATKDKISYEEASKLMGVDNIEVEMLVVEAITRGTLDARLDQVHKTIIIRHSEPRTYELEHWKRLDNRLAKWRTNLSSLLSVIKNSQQQLGTLPVTTTTTTTTTTPSSN